MTRTACAVIAAALVAAVSFQARAQTACGPHDDLVALLADQYGETLAFAGRHPSAPLVLELYVNDETGSWTIVQSNPETTCMTASGRDGRLVPDGQAS
jgi:hypothetical protein